MAGTFRRSLGPGNKNSDSVLAVESRNVGIQLSLARAKQSCQRPLWPTNSSAKKPPDQAVEVVPCQMDLNYI